MRNGSGADLVGRDRDLAVIRGFIDQAAAEGGALVVSGDAGVGKTALIEAGVSHAVRAGTRVLRATGAQFEANVSFAGLHQVLFPLLDSHLGQLDDTQQAALRSALGLGAHGGEVPDSMTLPHAALELLTRAASGTPILVVVDDVPWLDKASGRVLAFIARRSAGTRLGLLATMRTGDEGLFDRSAIATYELAPLSHISSEALRDSRYPALAARARYRLLTEAQGNPLALLELPVALTTQNAGRVSASTLPLTSRLQAVFAARIGGLPASTRHALLLAALRYGEPVSFSRWFSPDGGQPSRPGAPGIWRRPAASRRPRTWAPSSPATCVMCPPWMLPDPGDASIKALIEALYMLLMVSFFGGRPELWPAFHAAAAAAVDPGQHVQRPGPARPAR